MVGEGEQRKAKQTKKSKEKQNRAGSTIRLSFSREKKKKEQHAFLPPAPTTTPRLCGSSQRGRAHVVLWHLLDRERRTCFRPSFCLSLRFPLSTSPVFFLICTDEFLFNAERNNVVFPLFSCTHKKKKKKNVKKKTTWVLIQDLKLSKIRKKKEKEDKKRVRERCRREERHSCRWAEKKKRPHCSKRREEKVGRGRDRVRQRRCYTPTSVESLPLFRLLKKKHAHTIKQGKKKKKKKESKQNNKRTATTTTKKESEIRFAPFWSTQGPWVDP